MPDAKKVGDRYIGGVPPRHGSEVREGTSLKRDAQDLNDKATSAHPRESVSGGETGMYGGSDQSGLLGRVRGVWSER